MPISYSNFLRVSDRLREETFKERSSDTLIALMTLTHHTWDEPLLFTTAAKDVLFLHAETNIPQMGVISRGQQYMFIGVGLQSPSTQEDSAPQGRITFSNVGQEAAEKLMIVDRIYPRMTIELVAWSNPDVVESIWPNLSVNTASWDDSQGEISLVHKTASQEAAPFRVFSFAEFPNVHVQ